MWADGAYGSREVRPYLRRLGIKASIPQDPRGRRRPKVGRPYRFRQASCQAARGAVERLFTWRKGGFPRLALRHERLLGTFTAFVYLACFIITWLC